MEIFSKKTKKWWQLAPSDRLSNKEQIEIFILIVVVTVFLIIFYHNQVFRIQLLNEKVDRVTEQTEIYSEMAEAKKMIRQLEIELKSQR